MARTRQKICACASESVGIIVADEFFNKRGEIITLANDNPPKISNLLRVSVFLIGKNSLAVEKIIRTVDASTLVRQENSHELKRNDIGEIIFKLKNKVAFDEFGRFQATGRFVLVDG